MSMSLIVGTHYLGQTSWWLNAENHRVVAWAVHSRQQVAVSATGFTTKQNARRAAESVRAGASASSGP
jgi:uncharacterized protein YegP (UPF0339 family)